MFKTAITTGQLAKFLSIMEQRNMTPERFQTLLESGVLTDFFDDRARHERVELRDTLGLPLPPQGGDYRLTVDYGIELTSVIAALSLTYATSDYEKATADDFDDLLRPWVGISKVTAKLYEADEAHRNNHQLLMSEIATQGCRPANIWEALAFIAQYPKQGYVVVCGTKFNRKGKGGKIAVPVLYDPSDASRANHPNMLPQVKIVQIKNAGWSSLCRFLIVKK